VTGSTHRALESQGRGGMLLHRVLQYQDYDSLAPKKLGNFTSKVKKSLEVGIAILIINVVNNSVRFYA